MNRILAIFLSRRVGAFIVVLNVLAAFWAAAEHDLALAMADFATAVMVYAMLPGRGKKEVAP